MNMQSSFLYGYGFPCTCDDAKLIAFIKNHKDTFCQSENETALFEELRELTKNTSDIDMETFFQNYSCDASGVEGFGSVIANIISRQLPRPVKVGACNCPVV